MKSNTVINEESTRIRVGILFTTRTHDCRLHISASLNVNQLSNSNSLNNLNLEKELRILNSHVKIGRQGVLDWFGVVEGRRKGIVSGNKSINCLGFHYFLIFQLNWFL